MDIYHCILEDRRDAAPFILHDGPPYTSGEPHIGTGLNKILKDITVKYWSMRRKRVAFVPGWDCHAYPVEYRVLRDLREESHPPTPQEIRELCSLHVTQFIHKQKEQFQKLGIFADWDRPYVTMSRHYQAAVLEVLSKMVVENGVYKAVRPVYWCTTCKTVTPQTEVDLGEGSGDALDIKIPSSTRTTALIKFVAEPGAGSRFHFGDHPFSLLIYAKTIWPLSSCVAVAVDGDRNYVTLRDRTEDGGGEMLLVADDVADSLCERFTLERDDRVAPIKGCDLEGIVLAHPFMRRALPIIFMNRRSKEDETGIAAICPANNFDDFDLTQEYAFKVLALIDEQGAFTSEAGEALEGQNVYQAEESILDCMRSLKTLSRTGAVKYRAPQGMRCKHQLIIRATEQWFVHLDYKNIIKQETLREQIRREVLNFVRWNSEETKESMLSVVEKARDLCISRQKNWGIPLPALQCNTCKKSNLTREIVDAARSLIAARGENAWFNKSVPEIIAALEQILPEKERANLPDIFRCICGGTDLRKEDSVLDVWFESGSSWNATLVSDHRLSFPADICIEGKDQLSGWFWHSLVTSVALRGKAPFKAVLTHGFVVNHQGKKMSKRRGDFVSLKEAVEKVPADLIRYYCIWERNITEDIRLDISAIKRLELEYSNLRKLLYRLVNLLYDYIPREDVIPLADLHDFDQWILCKLHLLINSVTSDYEDHKLKKVIHDVYDFCIDDLQETYLRVAEDRLLYEAPGSPARRSAQTAIHSILVAVIKMLAPILVHTCDEIWSLCPGRSDCSSVHLSLWPDTKGGIMNVIGEDVTKELEERYKAMCDLRSLVRPVLEQRPGDLGITGTQEAVLTLFYNSPGPFYNLVHKHKQELQDFLRVSEITITNSPAGLEPTEGDSRLLVHVDRSRHRQCVHCQKFDVTVRLGKEQPALCERCINAITLYEYFEARPYVYTSHVTRDITPANLAYYLKEREIRRVAFIKEGEKCAPYFYDLPTGKVLVCTELQDLADYINNSPDFKEHRAILLGLGENTDVLFGIGIHNLKRGAPLGGTREGNYETVEKILEDLLRLSYGMSLKNAIGELPHGGGKSIIDTCGLDVKVHRELRRRIYRDLGQFTASLFGRYICAEDMGNSPADTREMLAFCRHVMCLPEGVGGSGNPSRFTALVGWIAAKAGWKSIKQTDSLDGLTVAIQGAGNVGQHLIDILTEGEPGLKKILVADSKPEQIEVVRRMLERKKKGHLFEERKPIDPLEKWMKLKDVDENDPAFDAARVDQYILYTDCDILFPVAAGKVIYPANVPFLKCKVIVPVANNAYTNNDEVARKIFSMKDQGKEIVDVVENSVNWGGATVAASELFGYDEDNVIEWCVIKAYEDTENLLNKARIRGVPPWEILKEEAEDAIKVEHPIIEVARRGYEFIGDIERDFNGWLKNRWLPNITGVASDDFARHAVDKVFSYKPRVNKQQV